MSTATQSMSSPTLLEAHEPLAARMARTTSAVTLDSLPGDVVAKAKLCLMDIVGCAFESRDLPWSVQAKALAAPAAAGQGATIIGASQQSTHCDAAFANA